MKNKSLNLKTKELMKRAVSFVTAVVMAVTILPLQPVTAFAADAHSHPVCGEVHSDIGDHTGSCAAVEWTELTGSTAMPSAAGSYYLTADITLTETWTIPENTAVNLCLNGHYISGDNSVQVIHVSPGATLNLCDCSTAETGKITKGLAKQNAAGSLYNAGGGIGVNRGTLNIYGGSITGNCTNYFQAGGVNVYGGTLRMYDGAISNNTAASSGGGVCIQNFRDTLPSEFTMYGGTISGNTAADSGGGVYIVDSIFNMHDGTISGNTANGPFGGGGVGLQASSSGTISGGIISSNTADRGGGISMAENSTLYLAGKPVIENNTQHTGYNEIYKNHSTAATDVILDNVIITAPLTDGAVIPSADYKAGDIVAKGTDSYTVAASDMAKFKIPAGADYEKVLDSTSNRIVLGHDLTDGGMVTLEYSSVRYDGTDHKPLVLVTYKDRQLTENTHYTVIWPEDTVNAGDKTVTVQGIFGANDSCYVGTLQSVYIIVQKPVTPAVSGIEDSYSYTGTPIKPAVTVTDGETVFAEGTDYTVDYGNNTTVSEGGTVKVEMKGNYSGGYEKSFAITKAIPDLTNVTATIPDNEDDISKIVFSGTTVGRTEIAGSYTATAPDMLELGENTVSFVFTPDDRENYTEATGTATVTVTDTVVPTGEVTIAENEWTEFSDNIAFDIYFKENVDVKVTASDNFSGIKSVEYIESGEVLSLETLQQSANWNPMGAERKVSVTAEDAKKFIYYIRITDNANNMTIISSNGIVFDLKAPVISGVTDGTTYYTTQEFTVDDANLKEVTINGTPVTDYILAGNTEAEYTVEATDKAGNSTKVAVQMKALNTLSDNLQDVSAENITDVIIENLENVKELLENAMGSEVTTTAEKAQTQDILDEISTIADAIAVDYKIIHGANSSWTQSSGSTLGFTADGAFSQFKEVRIADAQGDRTTLIRDTDYTAFSGSTIVTLYKSYLDMLAVGQYKLEIAYDILGVEHIAECSFTVKAKPVPAAPAAPAATPTPTPAIKPVAKPTPKPEPTQEPVEETDTPIADVDTGDEQQKDNTDVVTPQEQPADSTSFPILPVIIAIAAVMIILIILKRKRKEETEE